VTPDADEHPAPTWGAFCDALEKSGDDVVKQWHFRRGHSGLGVSVSAGGDGVFPVYVRFGSDGRALEAKVVFDEEE
jgi:hypothetical protein